MTEDDPGSGRCRRDHDPAVAAATQTSRLLAAHEFPTEWALCEAAGAHPVGCPDRR
jgi:hypothetical protein